MGRSDTVQVIVSPAPFTEPLFNVEGPGEIRPDVGPYYLGQNLSILAVPAINWLFSFFKRNGVEEPTHDNPHNFTNLQSGEIFTAVFTEMPAPCIVDTNCPIGQVCVSGTCVDHEPCPTGTHWDESQKACVADMPCTVDSDCPTGQICQDGVCVTPPPPFDWMQIGILAILATATILVTVGTTTTKD